MDSDTGWKVVGPREIFRIVTKGFEKSSTFLQKSGGWAMLPPPLSSEALYDRA